MTWTYRNDGMLKMRIPDVRSSALIRPRPHASAKPIIATRRSTHAPSTKRCHRSVTTLQSNWYPARKIIAGRKYGGRPGRPRPPPPPPFRQTPTTPPPPPPPPPKVLGVYFLRAGPVPLFLRGP